MRRKTGTLNVSFYKTTDLIVQAGLDRPYLQYVENMVGTGLDLSPGWIALKKITGKMCSRFETRIPARLWNKSNERILNYKFNNVRSGNLISAQRDYVRRAAILASGGVT